MKKINKHWMWALAPAFAFGLAACEDDVETVGDATLPGTADTVVVDGDDDVDPAVVTTDVETDPMAMPAPVDGVDEPEVLSSGRVEVEREIDVTREPGRVAVPTVDVERGTKTVTKQVEMELPDTITKEIEMEVPTADVIRGEKVIEVGSPTVTVETEQDPEGGENPVDIGRRDRRHGVNPLPPPRLTPHTIHDRRGPPAAPIFSFSESTLVASRCPRRGMLLQRPHFHSPPESHAMDQVRMGIIGLGSMGWHHAKYLNDIDGCTFAAACDAAPELVERAVDEMDVRGFSDADELLDSGRVNAVLIATPHYFHPMYAEAAFRRGIHVLVEKPVAVTAKAAQHTNDAYGASPPGTPRPQIRGHVPATRPPRLATHQTLHR